MKIVVASRNPVKIGAAREAFATQFPDAALEVLREVNATTSDWFEYTRSPLPAGVEVYGFHNSSVMTPGAVPVGTVTQLKRPSNTGASDQWKEVYCYTHGSCEAVTFYVEESNGINQTRVAIMPLLGSPQIFRNW